LVEDHFLARVALRSVLNGRFEVSIAAEAETRPTPAKSPTR